MEQTDKLEIDTTTPTASAILVDRRESMFLQHGGAVTRAVFDEVNAMSVDDFIKHEVPKIAEAHKTEDLVVLRDRATQQLSLLYGDQVLQYKIKHLDDCGLTEFVRELKQNEPFSFISDIPYPLVGFVETETDRKITVSLPSERHHFSWLYNSRGEHFETDIYLPPMWFNVTLNRANALRYIKVAVVTETSKDIQKTKLKCLPLPNIQPGIGAVCLGNTQITTQVTSDNPTYGEIICLLIAQVFDSQYNEDLLYGMNSAIANDAYNSMPKLPEFENLVDKVRASTSKVVAKVLRVLQNPSGWMRLDYQPLQNTASEFIRGSRE